MYYGFYVSHKNPGLLALLFPKRCYANKSLDFLVLDITHGNVMHRYFSIILLFILLGSLSCGNGKQSNLDNNNQEEISFSEPNLGNIEKNSSRLVFRELENKSDQSLTAFSFSIEGTSSLKISHHDCNWVPLVPGAKCGIDIDIKADNALGKFDGVLVVKYKINNQNRNKKIALNYNIIDIARPLKFNADVYFKGPFIAANKETKKLTLENISEKNIEIVSIDPSSNNFQDIKKFKFDFGNCRNLLPAGTCEISVDYSPTDNKLVLAVFDIVYKIDGDIKRSELHLSAANL